LKAVILAAGEGVRLQPITLTKPKHLIEIGGKPILAHGLNAVKASGINEVLIVVHYMADAIRDYFGDGERFGLKIEYAEQKGVLGTGNAVSVVEPYVEDDFLLVYGDLLFTSEAVRKVLATYNEEKPAATMAVVSVESPENYGVVELREEKYVKRIVEKPNRFDKVKETSASARGEWEITDAISLLLTEKKPVLAVKIPSGEWFDIGRPWDLLEANRWALLRINYTGK